MIEKIRRFQDSWFVKGILVLTALSFVSLFGITGYIDTAGKNEPVIEVGDISVLKDDITSKFNSELSFAKNIFGEGFDATDAIKSAMMQGIVQKELSSAIINNLAKDNNVHISDDLIRHIIFSQAEFMGADGKFDRNKFRRLLGVSGWSEARYIDSLKQDIIKQHLVQTPISNINIPKVLEEKIAQIKNNKRIYKYIVINPNNQKIDRKISNDELEQYYQDFAAQFIEPEKRDASFVLLSLNDVIASSKISNEEVEEFYNNNIKDFVIPEQRDVLQMVFDSEAKADTASSELKAGKDFYAVAKKVANQSIKETNLGFVSKDMLIADMSEEVFAIKKGEYTRPTKSDLGWHIMKVVNIKPLKETKLASVKVKIANEIKKMNAYDKAQDIANEIDDKIGAGEAFDKVAKEYNLQIHNVKSLNDRGLAKNAPAKFKALVSSPDFIEAVYSYNKGEVAQIFETQNGFVLVKIDNVVDAHSKPIESVRAQIEKIWVENEKSAISQEVVNDVMHDLEEGDSINEVASRFKQVVKTTAPINREGSFAGLNELQVQELFNESIKTPKLQNVGDSHVISFATKSIQDKNKMSREDIDLVKNQIKSDVTEALANTLIDAYGSEYDVYVDSKYLPTQDKI